MTAPAAPGPDAIATVLLTTRLAMPSSAAGSPRPLGPTAYASLRERLAERGIAPSALIGMNGDHIASMLDLDPDRAGNLASLLARAGQVSLAVDRLAARGIWFLDQASPAYPRALVARLGSGAPPVLFGSGDVASLAKDGLAIVGSRDVDETLSGVAGQIAKTAARGRLGVVSGGAKGVDASATSAALGTGGTCIAVVADSLERRLREPAVRQAVANGQLVLLCPYGPSVPFSRGFAMGRNKLIYCLSVAAVVVCSTKERGGTWAGAIEALDQGWVPVFAWTGEGAVPGNRALVERGARPMDEVSVERLRSVVGRPENSRAPAASAVDVGGTRQETLFGEEEPLATGHQHRKRGPRRTR